MTQTIGIVGYGNQGKSWAANLRDEGWKVSLLFRPESAQKSQAEKDGFDCLSLDRMGDFSILALLIPDDALPSFVQAYGKFFQPHQSLVFAHGFSVHYKTAPWPQQVDLILVAPKGIGRAVREKYLVQSGVPAVLAVNQDASGQAWSRAKDIASGLGAARVGTYEATFREEVESDLFSEQALLCGGLPALIAETFQTLTSEGVQPEVAYLECVHELAFITDLIQKRGIAGMLRLTSPTARFGGLKGAPQFRTPQLRETMKSIFTSIREGQFAKDLTQETRDSFNTTKQDMKDLEESQIETVGNRVRQRLFEAEEK